MIPPGRTGPAKTIHTVVSNDRNEENNVKNGIAGIDPHANSLACRILQKGREEVMQSRFLRNGGMSRFIATLRVDDEAALETTGDSAWFRGGMVTNAARVVVVARRR